jgi:hypothetical protein
MILKKLPGLREIFDSNAKFPIPDTREAQGAPRCPVVNNHRTVLLLAAIDQL